MWPYRDTNWLNAWASRYRRQRLSNVSSEIVVIAVSTGYNAAALNIVPRFFIPVVWDESNEFPVGGICAGDGDLFARTSEMA
jgi:hypothetical protein